MSGERQFSREQQLALTTELRGVYTSMPVFQQVLFDPAAGTDITARADLLSNQLSHRINSSTRFILADRFRELLRQSHTTEFFRVYMDNVFQAIFDIGRKFDPVTGRDPIAEERMLLHVIDYGNVDSGSIFDPAKAKEIEKQVFLFAHEHITWGIHGEYLDERGVDMSQFDERERRSLAKQKLLQWQEAYEKLHGEPLEISEE